MGSAIARRMIAAHEDVTVWNRTAARAEPLRAAGAKVAATAAEAVAGCDVVFTMLIDDRAVDDVMGEVRENLPWGAIHVALSTLSVEMSRKLTAEHAGRGQHFVAAPVFGRPQAAEAGKLWVAVGGGREAIETIRPVLAHFSRGVTVVSENPWSAHALKLGGNFLITAMIASLTESFVYAEAQGIDPGVFLETVNSALFQSPFYEMYGKIMLRPPATPGATMTVGEKDMRLFRDAAQGAQVGTPLADLFLATFHRAFEAGMKDADWAAGYYRLEKGLETRAP
jgi:3-hydroxyisobutyrate dehydrogenase-like beta-hydroxyacid dehydrogenase